MCRCCMCCMDEYGFIFIWFMHLSVLQREEAGSCDKHMTTTCFFFMCTLFRINVRKYMRERCLKVKIKKRGDRKMAEFDYEVVNGRKIRVRPVETVLEVDENRYFHRQPNHFTKRFRVEQRQTLCRTAVCWPPMRHHLRASQWPIFKKPVKS